MKKRLITLILSVMLALSVVSGATFALFTTETKVNVAVTSGIVELKATADDFETYSAKWDDVNDKYIDNKNAGLVFATLGEVVVASGNQSIDIINMVPGDSVKFNIYLENSSNVAIMYKVVIAPDTGSTTDLFTGANPLEFTIGTQTYSGVEVNSAWTTWLTTEPTQKTVEVTIKLPVEAGNEYQDKVAKLTYKVIGVQANANTDNL